MAKHDEKPSISFIEKVTQILQAIFRRFSKLFDRVIFTKKGSVVVSLLLAIIIVISTNYEDLSVNLLHDTNTTTTISSVPVEVLADTDTYDIEGVPGSVDVTLKGDASSIQVYRSQQTIKAIVDLRKYNEGNATVDFTVSSLPSNIEATISPKSADVTISKKMTKQFTIQTELMLGTGQSNDDFETPELATTSVEIKASKDQLNSIRCVKAIIDTTGYTSDFETEATLVAYDASGNKVQVDINPSSVLASVKFKQDESSN